MCSQWSLLVCFEFFVFIAISLRACSCILCGSSHKHKPQTWNWSCIEFIKSRNFIVSTFSSVQHRISFISTCEHRRHRHLRQLIMICSGQAEPRHRDLFVKMRYTIHWRCVSIRVVGDSFTLTEKKSDAVMNRRTCFHSNSLLLMILFSISISRSLSLLLRQCWHI